MVLRAALVSTVMVTVHCTVVLGALGQNRSSWERRRYGGTTWGCNVHMVDHIKGVHAFCGNCRVFRPTAREACETWLPSVLHVRQYICMGMAESVVILPQW